MADRSIADRLRSLLKWVGIACGLWILAFLFCWLISDWLFIPDADDYYGDEMPADVRGHLEYFHHVWKDVGRRKAALDEMSAENPEWDFISRTFLGYSLANVALKYPDEKERSLQLLDTVIDDTVKVPWRDFLLPYGKERPFFAKPQRSIMVDGELALMIGLRRLVEDPQGYPHRKLHGELIKYCIDAIERQPTMVAESYPDECWLWCVPCALAAVRVWDVLEGEDHSDLFVRWEKVARARLIKPSNGLFYSAVRLDGEELHKPEGSTIWMGAYFLEPVCPDLAREQYAVMKEKLSGRLLCFGYGREWPKGEEGEWDIDSGYTPFGMGPASTGFAMIASKELDDRDFFVRLVGILDIAGVPRMKKGQYRYASSNLVGDATFLLAKTTGPAWDEVERRMRERKSK